MSKYETGERRLNVIEFIEVADALGVDAGALLLEVRKALKRPRRH